MDAIRIQAKFILTSATSLLHPGQVVIQHGRVVDVAAGSAQRPDVDLGDVLLMPGLINAHTHLEFSDLTQPFPAGDSFPDWIGRVVSHRRHAESQLNADEQVAKRRSAILAGLVESFCTGTYVLADIVSHPWLFCDLPTRVQILETIRAETLPHLDQRFDIRPESWHAHFGDVSTPRTIAMPELIGLSTERFQATVNWAEQLLGEQESHPDTLLHVGLSPHSPYSISIRDLEAASDKLPKSATIAMHVAESRDELQWLEQGNGPFGESFRKLNIPIPDNRSTIQDALRFLSAQKRALLIHGNFLTEQDASFLAQSSSTSVVYCPRTHSHFGHPAYPLKLLRENDVRVVLATDSRASNPDLQLWREVVHARARCSELAPQDAFAAVTLSAAGALGIEQNYGSITKGKVAALNATPCQYHWTDANLLEEITSTDIDCIPLALLSSTC